MARPRKKSLNTKELITGVLPVQTLGDDAQARVDFPGGYVQAASYQGERDYQEDRFLIQAGMPIAPQETRGFLTAMFQKTAQKTKRNLSGASGTAVIVTEDFWLDAAYLGDSPLVLMVRDPATGRVATKQLTKNHHAANPEERKRIRAEGGRVSEGRIDGELMLSRSFGDTGYVGLSHEPEFISGDLKKFLDEGKEVYLLLSSDGLYDGELQPRHYAAVLKKAIAEGKKDKLAEIFSAYAHQVESEDNITAMVVQVTKDMKGGLFLAVADGHGGHQTSEAVVRLFKEDLKAQSRQARAAAKRAARKAAQNKKPKP